MRQDSFSVSQANSLYVSLSIGLGSQVNIVDVINGVDSSREGSSEDVDVGIGESTSDVNEVMEAVAYDAPEVVIWQQFLSRHGVVTVMVIVTVSVVGASGIVTATVVPQASLDQGDSPALL